ncbi:glycoside hydrolase family 35 protein [Patellaria atrata CBS 101060]|uniref:beta-galactosidase n=1 Tax=Patellaria atrata CBS 101060 TaxID=1346257 RepID=A0A9P4SL37_9PEZI|nr:glycoside hydrolase family 35 protein [Patellaria atrata CBS 101060]
MKLLKSLGNCLSLIFLLAYIPSTCSQVTTPEQWPLHDNGLNEVVEWDHFSFQINGKRLFVFSGELHYWRIPVPEVWEDLLQKIKAAGFTAYAFYGHWGYHSSSPSTLDFTTGAHDITPLFEIAKKVGLYIIVRPGPYVNAETNAGGFPLWLTTGAYGELRDNDPRYTNAWKPYWGNFSQIASQHQVTNDGNMLVYQMENEYGEQWIGNPLSRVPNQPAGEYMRLLQDSSRKNGITVPVIHNDPNMRSFSWSKDFSNATGNVDVAGLDSYPSCWSCNLEECTGTNGEYVAYQTINYYDHFVENSNTQPRFFPEFQGGSYNPWGGPQGGCPNDIGPDFANLFYRDLIAQRVTAISLYMMYGGTNWGAFACPVTATSYDYSSPISENRTIGAKYYETKNLAMFTRAAEDLTVTNRIGNSTSYSTNPAVKASELRNPETGAGFYVTIHSQSSSGTRESFQLRVNTSVGALTIPQYGGSVILNGHQSKILVTDFRFGTATLIYSTAEVLTYAVLDKCPVLVLWVPTGELAEFFLKGARKGSVEKDQRTTSVKFHRRREGLIVGLTQSTGMTVIEFDNDVKVIVVDRSYAYRFWAPNLSIDPFAPVDQSVLVQGPYLVRSAELTGNKKTISLTGDSDNATSIEVFAPHVAKNITWNGKALRTMRTGYGSLTAKIPAVDSGMVQLPPLNNWKAKDSLPERLPSYNDSGIAWADANHTETPNIFKPDTLPVLYVDDYGFHNSLHLFRGYFKGPATGVYLAVQGGNAFGWSAFLNGKFIGSYFGNSSTGSLGYGNMTISFGNVTLNNSTAPNVLLMVQDNTGHDLRSLSLYPRGILNATLLGSSNATFTCWKIAGEAGGNDGVVLDPVRAPLNEGGLTAERLGWHLPGFDDSNFEAGDPSTGFEGAGVRFYRTVVPLDIPVGKDVSISFTLNAPGTNKLRAQLFVNGYQYGKFNPYIGHQIEYPIPPGILNYAGDNTIGLAVWAQSDEGAKVDITWKTDYVLNSGWNSRFDSEYLRPAWSEERLRYV